MSSFVVLLDTCVLFPMSLRDTLLRAAEKGLYKVQFTEKILEELRKNLVTQRGLEESKAQYLVDKVKEGFPEALVSQYESLIPAMTNQEKDRHVLAAAVKSGAKLIVTENLKDFPQRSLAPFEIEAQRPDQFLINLLYLAPEVMAQIISEQARDLRNPPMGKLELLDVLKHHVPKFVELVLAQF